MEAAFLPTLEFKPSSFPNRQNFRRMNILSGVAPLQQSALSLPKFCTIATDRFSPRALFRSDSFESSDDDVLDEGWEVAIDPATFEEVYPTLPKQKVANHGRERSNKAALGESTSKSILIPDEWVSVQKHHLRTKRERKQEALALQIQRAREREAEERAIKEQAARDAQTRLYNSVYFNPEISRNSCVSRREEGNVSTDEDEVASSDDYADDRWEKDEGEAEEEDIVAQFEIKEAAAGRVSGRARPKDYRSGLEFISLEEVAERLREVVEGGTSSSSSNRGSADNVQDEPPLIVQLTPEEKAMLKSRYLNFATISSESWSPLHTLAAAGQVYLAAELMKRGAQVDALDRAGCPPILRAIQGGRKMMVRLLLKAGANPHFRDKDGATLLHYAAQTGNHDIAKLLLRDNVDVNAADKDGWTPLHVAVQTGRTELIKCLIRKGADMNQSNNNGKSSYDLSLTFGNCFNFYDTIKFMKRKEAESLSRKKSRDSKVIHDQ